MDVYRCRSVFKPPEPIDWKCLVYPYNAPATYMPSADIRDISVREGFYSFFEIIVSPKTGAYNVCTCFK